MGQRRGHALHSSSCVRQLQALPLFKLLLHTLAATCSSSTAHCNLCCEQLLCLTQVSDTMGGASGARGRRARLRVVPYLLSASGVGQQQQQQQ